MNKTIGLLICAIVTLAIALNLDNIADYVADFLSDEKTVYIGSKNEYTKDYDFKFVQMSKDYIPYSYQGLLNIIYSTLNNGWETFTFYCPDEYENCLTDIGKISKDTTLLSNINNFISPYNSYSKIGIETSSTGEITIKNTKLYNSTDINKIDKGVNEIITQIIKEDMKTEDKILAVHDYIINNTRYDSDKNLSTSYTALGPLYEGYAVCSGYADLMELFLTKFGVKNFKVASTTHVWNAAYVNGEWLNIDLTWDDPITKNSDTDTLLHQFFLVNTKTLLEFDTDDHNFDATIYQELK